LKVEQRILLLTELAKLTKKALRGEGRFLTGIKRRTEPEGTPFEPLKESTLSIRKKRDIERGPEFILRETDKHILDQIKVLEVTADLARVGVSGSKNRIIAAAHHAGFVTSPKSMIPNKVVPARRIFGFSKELLAEFNKTIQNFLRFRG